MKWVVLAIIYGYSVLVHGNQNLNCAESSKIINQKSGTLECPNLISPASNINKDKARVTGGGLLPIGVPSDSVNETHYKNNFAEREHEINMRATRRVLSRICNKYSRVNSNQNNLTDLGECLSLDKDKHENYKQSILSYCNSIPRTKRSARGGILHGQVTGKNFLIEEGACIIGNVNFPDDITITKGTVIINLGNDVFDFKLSEWDLKSGLHTPKNQKDIPNANSKAQGSLQRTSLESGSAFQSPSPNRGHTSSPGAR